MIKRSKTSMLLLVFVITAFCLLGSLSVCAAGVNVVTSSPVIKGGKWVKADNGKLQYKKADGTLVQDTWCWIDGKLFCFNANGYYRKGWITYESNRYYANAKGYVYISKWKKSGDTCYYFMKNGRMAKSCFVLTKGNYYYLSKTGARAKSTWIKYKGKKYYINKSGYRVSDQWLKLAGKYYYFQKNGVLVCDQWLGRYYVGPDGARIVNSVVDGYQLDATGKRPVSDKFIIVGDSRTVGMSMAVSNAKTKYIGSVGMGYSWLKSSAVYTLRSYIKENADVNVVFTFGVNDLGNIDQYIAFYRQLIKEYPDTEFFFTAVNPVNETKEAAYGYRVKNDEIKAFNTKLKAAFPDSYLPTYGYLIKAGFQATDGIHYDSATYKKLYNYIVSHV